MKACFCWKREASSPEEVLLKAPCWESVAAGDEIEGVVVVVVVVEAGGGSWWCKTCAITRSKKRFVLCSSNSGSGRSVVM